MSKRIEELRKALGISQEKFGERLGVTRTAVCAWEKDRRRITEQTLKSICREYKVNYIWLTEGKGEMFIDIPDTLLDQIAEQYGLSLIEKGILKKYLQLSKEKREVITEFLSNL